MSKRNLIGFIWLLLTGNIQAQETSGTVWSMEQCMDYAVEHNHQVRQQVYNLNDYQSQRTRSIGSFLPYVSSYINVQNNFGRAIDPQTNTYTDVSTFSNGYSLSASLSIFEGFRRLHQLRMAKAQILSGKQALQMQKENVALNVLKAYLDAIYYQETLRIARRKLEQSKALLHQTQVMMEVGRKGEAEWKQMQASLAADEFETTHQQNLLDQALLTLKREMNYPTGDPLILASSADWHCEARSASTDSIYQYARNTQPKILQAQTALKMAEYNLKTAKADLYPSLSLNAGVSSSFFKNMNDKNARAFQEQMRNNAGQYLSATLSIPLFNRTNTLSSIRERRNRLEQAKENLEYEQQELQRLITEVVADWENAYQEIKKMEQKVEADSIAAEITIRKWEEGLASPIDVQTVTVALLQSQAQQLQCRLNLYYNTRLLNYYQGNALWTEK